MKLLPTIIPHDNQTNHSIYETNGDEIKAKFTGWKEQIPAGANTVDYYITEITITESSFDKKIEHVNYCPKTDSIEIHFFEKADEAFKEDMFPLKDCKLDALRFLIMVYKKGEKISECSSAGGSDSQPQTKKGSIIVGNP